MSEWIVQHDDTLETLSDAGRITANPLNASLSFRQRERASHPAFRQRFTDSKRSTMGSSLRFERRFASTTLPREAHLPVHTPLHSRLPAGGSTYVLHQLAYTVVREKRLCCVIPREKRSEHHMMQRTGFGGIEQR
jgi:hypothetical protein